MQTARTNFMVRKLTQLTLSQNWELSQEKRRIYDLTKKKEKEFYPEHEKEERR